MVRSAVFFAATAAVAFGGTPSSAQLPAPPSTRDFVQAAANSDRFEILEGQVAAVESRNSQVQAFAREMIRDHARTSQTLREGATQSGLTPPTMALSGDQQMMLSALQSQTGPDFDRTYARQQVLAHQQALVVEQGYARGGSDPHIQRAAQSAVPIIQRHLDMAQQLRAQLGSR